MFVVTGTKERRLVARLAYHFTLPVSFQSTHLLTGYITCMCIHTQYIHVLVMCIRTCSKGMMIRCQVYWENSMLCVSSVWGTCTCVYNIEPVLSFSFSVLLFFCRVQEACDCNFLYWHKVCIKLTLIMRITTSYMLWEPESSLFATHPAELPWWAQSVEHQTKTFCISFSCIRDL